MVRYLLDGGLRVVALLSEMRDDLHSGRWNPTWRQIPPAFLDPVESRPEHQRRRSERRHRCTRRQAPAPAEKGGGLATGSEREPGSV